MLTRISDKPMRNKHISLTFPQECLIILSERSQKLNLLQDYFKLQALT